MQFIRICQLTNGYTSPFNRLTKRGQDLTKGVEIPGLDFCSIGTGKQVTAWCYEGKPDLYKSRKASKHLEINEELLITYNRRIGLTVLGIIDNGNTI